MRSAYSKFGCLCAFVMLCNVARAEMVENPQYKAWAKFAVGSSSTLTIKSEMAGQSHTAQSKMTLSSVTDDEVVVQTELTVNVNGKDMTMPGQKMEFKKMIDPAAAPTPGQPKQIDPKLLENATEETVTVTAGTFKAKVIEMNTTQGGGSKAVPDQGAGQTSIKSKIWLSDDAPGGVVKMETTGEGAAKMSMTGELTAIDKK